MVNGRSILEGIRRVTGQIRYKHLEKISWVPVRVENVANISEESWRAS